VSHGWKFLRTKRFCAMNKRNQIVIYNLEMDITSKVLAVNIDWVESFAKNFKNVTVFTVHKGPFTVSENVEVIELGGGTLTLRIRAGLRLLLSFFRFLPVIRQVVVFHHMSSMTASTIGILYRLFKVPQGLWYSHSHADIFLRSSKLWIKYYFSTSAESFPIKSTRLHAIGHGIPTGKFGLYSNRLQRDGIVTVGRIVSIKKIERIIEAISISKRPDIPLYLIGEYDVNDDYYKKLVSLASSLKVEVFFLGSISYIDLPEALSHYSMIFSGTPKSIDKALIEGAASGCYVLSENISAISLTGMDHAFALIDVNPGRSLAEKIDILGGVPQGIDSILRTTISSNTSSNCDVSQTSLKISQILKGSQ
jgi:glycosyltransferase involved in cell wall biosynthesis